MSADVTDYWVERVFGADNDDLASVAVGELIARVTELSSELSQWRSVEDELPEMCTTVLVSCGGGALRLGYRGAMGTWIESNAGTFLLVTHWQPLPAPPEDK